MRYEEELEVLRKNNLYRELRRVKVANPFAYINNKKYLMLSSNDYLGLSRDARVIDAIKDIEQISQCSSRLVAGNDPLLEELEEELEEHKGYDILLYPTGYMANLAIATLTNENYLIVSDELNHASIVDACRLSRAKVSIFKHNDPNDLEQKLADVANKMIVTEGVFSMDGDFSRLREISDIAKEHDAMLVLDDAHGDFIYGRNFRGSQEEFDVEVDLITSSLSKALGCFGGYIASRKEIIEYLINRSRTFIYTSALPVHIARASIEALKVVREGKRQRDLLKVSKVVREGLLDLGFNVIGDSHIIPIIVGDEREALRLAEALLDYGIFVQAIRYPTVRKSNARLRLSLTSLHLEYVDEILTIFKKVS